MRTQQFQDCLRMIVLCFHAHSTKKVPGKAGSPQTPPYSSVTNRTKAPTSPADQDNEIICSAGLVRPGCKYINRNPGVLLPLTLLTSRRHRCTRSSCQHPVLQGDEARCRASRATKSKPINAVAKHVLIVC